MDAFSEIKESYQAGRPLPGMAYRDPDVYEAEMARLFRRGWISIACALNVPNSGDLLPIRIAGQSLFVSRDEEGRVQVFYNMCRHRGMRLVAEACQAQAGRIVCPYHGWNFGVDGQFKSAPYLQRDAKEVASRQADTDRLNLLSVRSAVWRDIVFVNLSGDAEPFEEFIRPLEERLSGWTESELRPLGSDEYEIQANWKLAAENFLDIYHLPVLHSEAGLSFSDAATSEDVELRDDIIGFVMSGGYDAESTADWKLPRFSGLSRAEGERLELFCLFPNTLLIVEPDSTQVIVLRPQSAGVTHETFANYVASDASQVDSLAEERAEYLQESVAINDQDAKLLVGLQEARSMDVGGETQPAESWDATLQRFQRLWAGKLLDGF